MNLDQISTKCWVLALFERDDGERFLLGDGWFDFKDSQQHFQPNTIASDIVELQGADGQLLAGQVRRSTAQSFDGYIGDAITSKAETERHRQEFLRFFQVRRFYKVIYIMPDGTAIQRRRGYLTDAPSVPEIRQNTPEYHVALNFEDVNYYEYSEDDQGQEIYSNVQTIGISSEVTGGLVWDANGAESDANGFVWEAGNSGGPTMVTNDGVAEALPVWKVPGPATNPSLTNITNGQILNFDGVVPAGQTLTVDMANQTATMAGANVFALISGDWIQLEVGTNKITYSAIGATAPSTLSWNDIVG